MIIGHRETFAVEVELNREYGGPWLFGKLCYWVCGAMVGDYNLDTSLRDVLLGMRWIVRDCGNRDGGSLCDVSPENAFSTINNSLYATDRVADPVPFQVPDTPARFDVTIQVDVFNQWKIFLIECDGVDRMLFRNIGDGDLRQATIPKGVFDEVLKQVFDYLSSLHSREGDSSS